MFCQVVVEKESRQRDENHALELLLLWSAFHQIYTDKIDPLGPDSILLDSCSTIDIFGREWMKQLRNIWWVKTGLKVKCNARLVSMDLMADFWTCSI